MAATVTIGPRGFPFWVKDPDARKDYAIDWSAWLGDATIVDSTWIVPSGLTHDAAEDEFSATVALLWLSGGTKGQRYIVTNRVTASDGSIEDQSIEILIRQK